MRCDESRMFLETMLKSYAISVSFLHVYDIIASRSKIAYSLPNRYASFVVVRCGPLPQSMDHRGTPEFPGLVATLVSDADLEVLTAVYLCNEFNCWPHSPKQRWY